MWFDNAEDCCKFFRRNGDCNVYNVCEENKPPIGGSADGCGLGWFPDIVNMDGCSNGKDYPLEWANNPIIFLTPQKDVAVYILRAKTARHITIVMRGHLHHQSPQTNAEATRWGGFLIRQIRTDAAMVKITHLIGLINLNISLRVQKIVAANILRAETVVCLYEL